jgi:hypothetical protein
MVNLNRSKYSKFSLNVLKAFVDLDEIIYQKDKTELTDWKSAILHINKNQSNILIGISDIADICEAGEFEKHKLEESRKMFFGDTPTESVLLKYCLNSKEIRSILQFLFSVYNFYNDLRRCKSKNKLFSVNSAQKEKSEINRNRR